MKRERKRKKICEKYENWQKMCVKREYLKKICKEKKKIIGKCARNVRKVPENVQEK